jgi:hypothetical protein
MAIEELAKQQIPGVGITNRGTVAESIRPGQLSAVVLAVFGCLMRT